MKENVHKLWMAFSELDAYFSGFGGAARYQGMSDSDIALYIGCRLANSNLPKFDAKDFSDQRFIEAIQPIAEKVNGYIDAINVTDENVNDIILYFVNTIDPKLQEDKTARWIRFLKWIENSFEQFETVWNYCTSNNRVVPQPMKWNELYGMLNNTSRTSSGGREPALPLILAAWAESPPLFKQLRLKEHIQWASDNDQIEVVGKYLRSLNEEDWFHFGE